jgi:ABC-type Fe3+/spermidine/putrescine transport system ATPase subunit
VRARGSANSETVPLEVERSSSPVADAVGSSIKCENVSVILGNRVVLRDFSLAVASAETVGILGGSGSGKTTLLNSIAGFIKPSSGDIRLLIDKSEVRAHPGTHIGYVFQDFALFPVLTVRNNIGFGLNRRQLKRAEVATQVSEIAEEFGIEHLLDRDPESLSGGEKQRVALARTLVAKPIFCLLDEPFSQLDLQLRTRVRRQTRSLLRSIGSTNLVVSHDFEDCAALCDRIGLIENGRMLQIGTPSQVYLHPASVSAGTLTGGLVCFAARSGGEAVSVKPTPNERISFACRPESIFLEATPDSELIAVEGFGRILTIVSLGDTVELQIAPAEGVPFEIKLWARQHSGRYRPEEEVHYRLLKRDAIEFSERAMT